MTRVYPPGSTIGVMGGGQLGRMFAMAARRMGYRVHIFTPEKDGPAAQFSDLATEADYLDENAVRRFARSVDLITFEFENIPAETISWAAYHNEVRPTGSVLEIAQNRLREKTFLADNNFPLPKFREVRDRSELESAVELIGRASILKTAAPSAMTAKASNPLPRASWTMSGKRGRGTISCWKRRSISKARSPSSWLAIPRAK